MQTLYIYPSKKKIKGQIILYIVLAIVFTWLFFSECHNYSAGNDYYPQAILFMPFGVIAMIVLIIKRLKDISNKQPMITISNDGIELHRDECSHIGLVRWADVTGCSDVTVAKSVSHKMLTIQGNYAEVYAHKIDNEKIRKRYMKRNKHNHSILWIEAGMLDYNLVELKKLIYRQINQGHTENTHSL